MLGVLKELLLKVVDDIDCGNSNIPDEKETLEIINMLKKYTRKDNPMSKYQAYTYLNISRATFDNMVRDGELPDGKKVAGFKEKFWYKKDLDEYIRNKRANKTSQRKQYDA